MDRGPCWATVHGVTESDTTEQLHFLSFFLWMFEFETPDVVSKCCEKLLHFFFIFLILWQVYITHSSPGCSDSKESVSNAGDPGSILGLG